VIILQLILIKQIPSRKLNNNQQLIVL
jgi:hypothetical protein